MTELGGVEKMEAKEQKYKVDFIICGHPEFFPRPKPCQTTGSCPIHNFACPVCGFGIGSLPECGCPERRY